MFNTTVSSVWTTSSRSYVRYGATSTNFYYDTFTVTVPSTGSYIFTSNGMLDTYGYLYSPTFSPTSTSVNLLIFDDDSGGNAQFRFIQTLQAGVTYVLVATTFSPSIIGSYTVTVSGLARATVSRTNTTSVTSINTTPVTPAGK